MRIIRTTLTKLCIINAPDLDPIHVIMERNPDTPYHAGWFTVVVFGRAWTTYWGNMGNSMREFVLSANTDYIVERLAGSTQPTNQRKRKLDEAYLTRIVNAIKDALRQEEGAS